MRGLTDRKTELGCDEIHQLRTAVVNGITDPEHRDFQHFLGKQKGNETEVPTTPQIYQCIIINAMCMLIVDYISKVSHSNVPILPRPLEANVMSNQPPSIVPIKPCCYVQSGTGPRYV